MGKVSCKTSDVLELLMRFAWGSLYFHHHYHSLYTRIQYWVLNRSWTICDRFVILLIIFNWLFQRCDWISPQFDLHLTFSNALFPSLSSSLTSIFSRLMRRLSLAWNTKNQMLTLKFFIACLWSLATWRKLLQKERERVITEKLPITIIFFLKKKVLYVIIAKH